MISCSNPDCKNTHPTHKWGSIKAQDSGWFEQRDGTAWCPDHIPAWVKAWREMKKHNQKTYSNKK